MIWCLGPECSFEAQASQEALLPPFPKPSYWELLLLGGRDVLTGHGFETGTAAIFTEDVSLGLLLALEDTFMGSSLRRDTAATVSKAILLGLLWVCRMFLWGAATGEALPPFPEPSHRPLLPCCGGVCSRTVAAYRNCETDFLSDASHVNAYPPVPSSR